MTQVRFSSFSIILRFLFIGQFDILIGLNPDPKTYLNSNRKTISFLQTLHLQQVHIQSTEVNLLDGNYLNGIQLYINGVSVSLRKSAYGRAWGHSRVAYPHHVRYKFLESGVYYLYLCMLTIGGGLGIANCHERQPKEAQSTEDDNQI